MIWLILACAPDPARPGTAPADATKVSQPALVQPATAPDLDPAEGRVKVELTAAPHTHNITDWRSGEVHSFAGYAYNGQTPGPTIRTTLGDTLVVELTNDLDVATTIHWHGLHVPWEMDGVTWKTDPIEPGEVFTYEFTLEQTGTYWYHPHFDTASQVDLGLYGVLIVEDPADPVLDEELVLVFDDWNVEDHDVLDPDVVHGAHGQEGLWTVNGLVRPSVEIQAGSQARIRTLNAANQGYLQLSWSQMEKIAGDQGRTGGFTNPTAEILTPGDRADFIWRPEESFQILDTPHSLHGGEALGEAEIRMDVRLVGEAKAPAPLTWPPKGGPSTPDPGRTDLVYTFQGETHPNTWMINGEVMPDVTIEELVLGEEAILEIRNLSATEHPFHLHGHAFEVLSIAGEIPTQATWEDTLNIPIHESARIRLIADNPGEWMAHCHILPHADGGMMTVLRVGEPIE